MSDTTGIYENVIYKKVKTNEQQQQPAKNLLQQTQEQVDELVEILHDNVDKALERENKLSDLNEISENLEKQASEFKTTAVVVKRKEWHKQMKTKLVFAGLGAILLIIIILSINKSFNSEPPQNPIEQTQKQVKELVEILQENVNLAIKREDNLKDLTKISNDLEMNAGQFKTTTDKVKRKVWWKQMKTKLVFVGLVVILLLILIFSLM
ncbi:Synaptobrevin [Lucilia cuprina]|nr:Synaptobrevin [Lucilia cuprina]